MKKISLAKGMTFLGKSCDEWNKVEKTTVVLMSMKVQKMEKLK